MTVRDSVSRVSSAADADARSDARDPGREAAPAHDGPEDPELVARARTGDRAALRRLVERHQRRVFQLAMGIVRDRDEALDVVQETFVKVHRCLPEFKGESAFGTWVHRIACNLAIDAVRRRGRGERVEVEENTLTDEAGSAGDWSGSGANPQQNALRRELGERLGRALEGLSENHRAILLLRELDGLSYEELAKVLGIPKGTVMSRLFHARHRMQQSLRPYLEGAPEPDEAAS